MRQTERKKESKQRWLIEIKLRIVATLQVKKKRLKLQKIKISGSMNLF